MSSILSYSVYPVAMDRLEFGEWIEDQYKGRGWKQKEFAAMIGRSNKTVSGWVNGVSTPRDESDYDRIGQLFDVDPNEVRRRAGRRPVSEKGDGMSMTLRPTPAVVEIRAGNARIGQAEYRLPILGYVPADSKRETSAITGRTLPVLVEDVAHLNDPVVFIATGECLLRRGIEPGTRVIVDRGARPEDGEVVVVQTLDGYTMKEWTLEGAEAILRASEPGYAPIRLRIADEGDTWSIVGVVRLRYGLDRV